VQQWGRLIYANLANDSIHVAFKGLLRNTATIRLHSRLLETSRLRAVLNSMHTCNLLKGRHRASARRNCFRRNCLSIYLSRGLSTLENALHYFIALLVSRRLFFLTGLPCVGHLEVVSCRGYLAIDWPSKHVFGWGQVSAEQV
jgi:hypothetical protein